MTASSGYDANTGEAPAEDDEEERELPSTVTLLISAEQSKVLAALEADEKLHLPLVYRGTPASTAKFIETQDKVNLKLYPVPALSESMGVQQSSVLLKKGELVPAREPASSAEDASASEVE